MSQLTAFLRHSFCDARGVPDGKLLTTFAVALVVVLSWPVGHLTGRWPPDYIYSPTLLFLATALGIDAFVTKTKIQAESPTPASVVGNAENVNVTQNQAASTE